MEQVDVVNRVDRVLGAISAAAGALFDISDRAARALGRTSMGIANTAHAAGKVTTPAAGASICTLAAPGAGIYEVIVITWVSVNGTDVANVELRRAGAALFSPIQANNGAMERQVFRRVTLAAGENLSVNAIIAGQAGTIYYTQIDATRIE